jgi:ATP-dependent DNA helicase RecG
MLSRLGIARVEDLLHHYPREHLDARRIRRVRDLVVEELCTVLVKVMSTSVRRRPGRDDFTARVSDETGSIGVIWFGQGYLSRTLSAGDELALTCSLPSGGPKQLVNPAFEVLGEEERELLHAGRIIPVHPLTAGISGKMMRRLVYTALDAVADLIEDPLPGFLRSERDLVSLPAALRGLHFPDNDEELARARHRLTYEELFLVQTLLAMRRARREQGLDGWVTAKTSERARALVDALPFRLTAAQKRVMGEILADQKSPRPMHRLLVGDVGSGKTLVALVACVHAVEAGFQTAVMAPTEILAEQHYRTLERLARVAELRTALLLGRIKGAKRREILESMLSGDLDLVVGTHAVFQEDVRFSRLGLVVVDEQHRFGVRQRAQLAGKAASPDVLVMTATPIPRTLALAYFGDLDLSTIDELPPGRGSVRTRVTEESKRERVYEFLVKEMEAGRQVYVVLPVIEESERADLRAATATYDQMTKHPLLKRFRWGLLHGRLKPEERTRAMEDFVAGRIRGVVSTTVIEVGIDVPNATVMLIEQAERFGLAQLHQLRGRVGRGKHVSTCILMTGSSPTPEAMERLQLVAQTQDGFRLAEADLRARGPGELWGTLQTGLPRFRIADPARDVSLLDDAHRDARSLVEADPNLERPEYGFLRRTMESRFGKEVVWNPSG